MEWIFLVLALILIILIIIFRKNPIVKKYWKYSLILLPGIVVLILKIVLGNKGNSNKKGGKGKELRNKVDEIKEEIQEAQMEAAIEVSVAKAKSKEKLDELKEVKKITDKKKRRRKLADMIN